MQVPPTSTPATPLPSKTGGLPNEAGQAEKQFELVLSKEISNNEIPERGAQGKSSNAPPEGKPDWDPLRRPGTPDASSAPPSETAIGVPAEPEQSVLQAPGEVLNDESSALPQASVAAGEEGDEELPLVAGQDSVTPTSAAAALWPAPVESMLKRPLTNAFDGGKTMSYGDIPAELPAGRGRAVSSAKDVAGKTSASTPHSDVLTQAHDAERLETDTKAESAKLETSPVSSPPFDPTTRVVDRTPATDFDTLRDGQPHSDPKPHQALSAVESARFRATSFELTEGAPVRASEKLHPRVGTSAWETALGHRISWMIGDQQQSASLTLEPPDLGVLHVVVTISQEQATAAFFAAQPEVRKALEAAIPRLREMMDSAGIRLGDATVSAGTSGNQDAPPGTRYLPPSGSADQQSRGPSAPGDSVRTGFLSRGLVDTFA